MISGLSDCQRGIESLFQTCESFALRPISLSMRLTRRLQSYSIKDKHKDPTPFRSIKVIFLFLNTFEKILVRHIWDRPLLVG